MTEPHDLILGTAGHIDHGKTALVRALTGVNTDRLPAEKQRGITIDLGFAALELSTACLGLVDVPGHERFIRNMLAGASGFDLALLVVAADDSVMPQTREHLEILGLLGLPRGVIALTKCDVADPTWLELVEDEVRALVQGTCLERAEIVRTSAVTGAGIDELKRALERAIAALPPPGDPGPFRIAIDRSFTVAGHGTIVTGTVASGVARIGDELEWLPEGRTVRIRGLHRHDRPVETLGRGARAALNLAGVRHDEVQRGQELATPGYLKPSRVLSIELRATPDAPRPLRHRSRYRLHVGTADVSASLALLDGPELAPGQTTLAQLFLSEPVAAFHGEPIVLRAESPPETLGGGRVLQPLAVRVRRRDHRRRELLARRLDPDPEARVAAALANFGLNPWNALDLCREAGVPLDEGTAIVRKLTESGAMVELPLGPRRSTRVLADFAADLEARLLRALGRLHAHRPRLSAARRSWVAAELADLGNEALISGLIERLAASGQVVATAQTVALKGHSPKLSQAERRLKNEIIAACRSGGMSPPDLADLTARAGSQAKILPELLDLLVEEGQLVEIAKGLYFDADTDAELRRRVLERLSDGSTLTMSELRDLLGTTRKYAVPLGEYLDRIGITQREGDVRRLGERSAAMPEAPPVDSMT